MKGRTTRQEGHQEAVQSVMMDVLLEAVVSRRVSSSEGLRTLDALEVIRVDARCS